jgi:ketosteroid isomerase-like protein
MRSKIAIAVFLVAMCLEVSAQQERLAGDESARLVSLENIWNQAEVKHDAKALSLMLAETFDFTDDAGQFMNKRQWLAHIEDEGDNVELLGNSEMVVHLHGDVAIAIGKYRVQTNNNGQKLVRLDRFTDTWIKRHSEWKCVASQATVISR